MDWNAVLATRSSRMKASEIRELLKVIAQPDVISFAGGIPDPKLFPVDAMSQAMTGAMASDQAEDALQYSVSEGYLPLREWIAAEMQRIGVPCGPQNIFISSGSQQALDYLGKLMISPGDTVLCGWPTYLGALGAFNAYEPCFEQYSPTGNVGATEYKARAAASGGRAKFAYMSVDFANPTGETLDRRARLQLLDLAAEMDIAIIEDAAYQALRYDGETIPPILALEIERCGTIEAARTIYCGSFSKTLAPGLRVGWVCAASPVIERLVLLKQAGDLHSASLNQIVVAEVAKTIMADHVKLLRKTYQARRDHMLAALEKYMPAGVDWTRPEGGMFIWVTLPAHMDGAELLTQSLAAERVAFVPGRAFFADGSGGNTLRLSFSCATAEQIDTGIKRLGALIERVGSGQDHR